MRLYDTNILISHLDTVKNDESFLLSSVTLRELEHIKTGTKSEDVKYAARKATRFLNENVNKYKVIIYDLGSQCDFTKYGLEDTHDNRIMRCAEYARDALGYTDLVFVTNDILCKLIAKEYFGLDVESIEDNHEEIYKGYREASMSEDEMAYFYEHIKDNIYGLLINEYLLIKNKDGDIVDKVKWTGDEHCSIICKPYKSNLFGTLKPLDEIQSFAMDSINTNEITVLFGKAGSGKTTIPLNFIMQELEKGKYKKCYLIYSFEPLKGAKVLGYEKGSHIDKLLYSASIGNILTSKIGDIDQVRDMLVNGQIEIVPTANIRGMEISDAICFVTECQNLDTYTLKTIIQRCKSGCKQIYEGDVIEQKDTNPSDSGMNRMIDVFKGHHSFGCLKLKNNYRSELCDLADKM